MLNDLLIAKMNDGSRHFVDVPEVVFFDDFYEHAESLAGAEITAFETDGTLEMWLEFEFRGHHFSVGNQFGDYWFFVDDPQCPEEVLLLIVAHFRRLLER